MVKDNTICTVTMVVLLVLTDVSSPNRLLQVISSLQVIN